MSDNKPPMTVWLDPDEESQSVIWGIWVNRPSEHRIGPYVHMEQFKSALIERAEQLAIADAEAAESDLPYPLDDCVNYWLLDAYDELAKEIMEGKA